MTTDTTTTYKPGEIVTYRDICNNSTFIVLDYNPNDPWSTYKLWNTDTAEIEYSDMGQRGWSRAA